MSWNHDVVGQSFMPLPRPDSIEPVLVEGAADIPYAIPNLRVAQHKANLPVQTQWMRSVGHTHSAFVGETMMDEAARAVAKEPYAFRHALPGSMPRHRGVLERAAQKAGWAVPLKPGRQGTRRGRCYRDVSASAAATIAPCSAASCPNAAMQTSGGQGAAHERFDARGHGGHPRHAAANRDARGVQRDRHVGDVQGECIECVVAARMVSRAKSRFCGVRRFCPFIRFRGNPCSPWKKANRRSNRSRWPKVTAQRAPKNS